MYKSMSIISACLISFSLLSSCSGQEKTETTTAVAQAIPTTQYEYANFDKIVFSQEGEFGGLDLFEDRGAVKTKLPAEALMDESEDFLYYQWDIDGNIYKLDLFFNEESKLKSIDGYISFYTKDGEKDLETAKLFYADMEKYFLEKYSEDNMESNEEFIGENDLKFISWYYEEKDVEVGLDDVEVYWYMSAYESLFEEEEIDPKK